MKLVYVGVAWLVGIWLAHALHAPWWGWLIAFAASLLVAFLLRRRRAAFPLLCAAFLCLAGARYGLSLPRIDDTRLAWYNDQGAVSIQGVVVGEPEPKGARWQARIAAEEIRYPTGYAPVRGTLITTLPAIPRVHEGDVVRVEGEMVTPPAWEEFNYRDYLAREGIYSLLRSPTVEVLRTSERRGLAWALSALRTRGEAAIAALLPEPEASLLTGILLGRDAGIPDDVMDAFRATGTAHIIAISGFNITIIAGVLLALLTRTFGRRWAVFGTVPIIIAYTVLVGGDPPVVRAAIMGCLSLAALRLGRRSDALNALALSALVMTAARPHALWDVGFQLSFAATLGIILYAAPLQRRFSLLIDRVSQSWAKGILKWVNDGLVATLAAQVLTLPLTVAYFHNLSPLGVLANLFIVPVQPQVMTWGGAALLLGLVWRPLGMPLAAAAWLFLTYTIRAAEFFARLPGGRLEVTRVPALVVVGYYVIVGILTIGSARVRRWLTPAARRWAVALRRWRVAGALAVTVALVWTAALQMSDGRLHVHFLDVGEGDAILIRTPGGNTALIDGGSDPAILLGQVGKRLPFWQREIDLVALTHPHADHAGGLIGVLERYRVGMFVEARPGKTPEYKACAAVVQAKGIPLIQAVPGQKFALDEGVTLEVLYPSERAVCKSKDENNCSLVLRLSMGSTSFLFPGDLESNGQAALMSERDVPPNLVLKVPHHGGEDALLEGFLNAVAPKIAVIQAGPMGATDPSPLTLRRLEAAGVTVWQTKRKGTLEIVTDGVKYWMK